MLSPKNYNWAIIMQKHLIHIYYVSGILYSFTLHSNVTTLYWLSIDNNRFCSQMHWQKGIKCQLSVVSVESANINGAKYKQILIQIQIGTWVRQNKYWTELKQVGHPSESSTAYQRMMYMRLTGQVQRTLCHYKIDNLPFTGFTWLLKCRWIRQ